MRALDTINKLIEWLREYLLDLRGHRLHLIVNTSGLVELLLLSAATLPDAIVLSGRAKRLLKMLRRLKLERQADVLRSSELFKPVDGALIRKGASLSIEQLSEWLVQAGFSHQDFVTSPNTFAMRGMLLEIYPEGWELPARVELDDDVVERITLFDPDSYISLEELEELLLPVKGSSRRVDVMEPPEIAITDGELIPEILTKWRDTKLINIGIMPPSKDFKTLSLGDRGVAPLGLKPHLLAQHLRKWLREGYELVIATEYPEGVRAIAGELNSESLIELSLSSGFLLTERKLMIISDLELTGTAREERANPIVSLALQASAAIKEGDLVSHPLWGVAIYRGIVKLESEGVIKDWLLLEFKGGEKLYLPPEEASLKKLYVIGPSERYLTKMGRTRDRSSLEDEELAKRLLSSASRRSAQDAPRLTGDEELEREFWNSFPYRETPEQLKAIEELLRDLQMSVPMERLLVGGTGYGKTEVALRGIFRAVVSGYQAWFIVPTSTLFIQQYKRIRERLEPFGVKVHGVMRGLRRSIREKLSKGEIDLLVSTPINYQMLEFRNLALIVVDEEHLLGVRYKEGLKERWPHVHVLYTSATPIPRTLFLALSGVIGLSKMLEPPIGIGEVQVEVLQHDIDIALDLIASVLRDSSSRAVYIYNRVEGLVQRALSIAQALEEKGVKVKVGVIHGRMSKREIERTLNQFAEGELRLLVSTTVFQAGMDLQGIALAYVEGAEMLGLAMAYQLRGRLARGIERATLVLAYTPGAPLSSIERLRLFKRLHSIGSLELAREDLSWRGAGGILSKRQHGKFDHHNYHLLLKAISGYLPLPTIKHSLEAFLPPSPAKLRIYNLLARVRTREDLRVLRDVVRDVYGATLPLPVRNLLNLAEVRLLASELGFDKIVLKRNKTLILERGQERREYRLTSDEPAEEAKELLRCMLRGEG